MSASELVNLGRLCVMECINKMGAFREVTQKRYENACNAFSTSQNLTEIARLTGVKKLADKLNPSQPHKLSAFELKLISKASGDMHDY